MKKKIISILILIFLVSFCDCYSRTIAHRMGNGNIGRF